MATHEELKKILIPHSLDYKDYGGKVDRDDPWKPDCSCGCKFFHPLKGEEGFDWGVCTNPKSHRCGLLTFEHQGCLEFEQGEESDEF